MPVLRCTPTPRRVLAASLAGAGLTLCCGMTPAAHAATPIPVGVMAPASAIDGRSIIDAAKLASSRINSSGGINGRPIKLYVYDDHFSAADAARAFQRAVSQNHVVAMVGIFTSEVALAMEPWSARLKTPLIVTGAATPRLEERVHADYARYKYVFHGYTNSTVIAKEACLATKKTIVDKFHYAKAVIFSENADWTKAVDAEYKKCLPEIGVKIAQTINFSPGTQDFTPLYNKIEDSHAQIIMAAIAHVGVKPVLQWHQQHVPALFAGINGQAGSSSFWKATNGATDSVITGSLGANGVPLTPKTPSFYKAYKSRFHLEPAYNAYTTYDAFYTLMHAIDRVKSTKPNALVRGIEQVDFTGVSGQIRYYGRHNKWTHEVVYSPDPKKGMSFVEFQWQHGKQVVIWPKRLAQGKIEVPSFIPKQTG